MSAEPYDFYIHCMPSVLTDNPGCGHRWTERLTYHPERKQSLARFGVISCPKCGGPVALASRVGDYAPEEEHEQS